ncbi:MAG: class I SAM-dependent methyltransferase [Candidatus Methanoperedens sp.]|nr:class I SAM-dependent methyltransferase [Candidatus Methanoperedens sp.]MCZ7405710.1 class I SAM-dependent methyltransferase [Candidatus Methanoperedens sp.]
MNLYGKASQGNFILNRGTAMFNSGKKSESLFWDKEYESNMRIWGDRPSELALIAVKYLQNHRLNDKFLSILDIGCGYGRDCLYLAKHLNCCVLGIDTSQKALEILAKSLVGPCVKAVQFRCCNFMDMDNCKYDIVFASNLYQILHRKQREELRKKITNLLKPQGLLFLNNLSVNDPEEYGKGELCPDEPNSFKGEKYLHFCTREELEEDFRFLTIQELYEHKYDEPRVQGKTHHHISWILIGELIG